jgi:hypothetical protein
MRLFGSPAMRRLPAEMTRYFDAKVRKSMTWKESSVGVGASRATLGR